MNAPPDSPSLVTTAEMFLIDTGRLLLSVSAMLFQAYLIMLIGCVVVAAVGSAVRSRRRHGDGTSAADGPRHRPYRAASTRPVPAPAASRAPVPGRLR